jgi:hypothetical protein
MIERMFGQVAQEPTKGFGGVKAMAFGKSLYLLEALLPSDDEGVGQSHLTGT